MNAGFKVGLMRLKGKNHKSSFTRSIKKIIQGSLNLKPNKLYFNYSNQYLILTKLNTVNMYTHIAFSNRA